MYCYKLIHVFIHILKGLTHDFKPLCVLFAPCSVLCHFTSGFQNLPGFMWRRCSFEFWLPLSCLFTIVQIKLVFQGRHWRKKSCESLRWTRSLWLLQWCCPLDQARWPTAALQLLSQKRGSLKNLITIFSPVLFQCLHYNVSWFDHFNIPQLALWSGKVKMKAPSESSTP